MHDSRTSLVVSMAKGNSADLRVEVWLGTMCRVQRDRWFGERRLQRCESHCHRKLSAFIAARIAGYPTEAPERLRWESPFVVEFAALPYTSAGPRQSASGLMVRSSAGARRATTPECGRSKTDCGCYPHSSMGLGGIRNWRPYCRSGRRTHWIARAASIRSWLRAKCCVGRVAASAGYLQVANALPDR
jgi:hypothetical protein